MEYCITCGAAETQDCKNNDDCDWRGMSSEKLAEELTQKLLPCPFCGGKPHESVFFCGLARPGHYEIKCINCSIVIRQDRQDKLIGMWNTRHTL